MRKIRLFSLITLLIITAFTVIACQPQQVEVTRVVSETITETITEQVEVTRVVEGETVTEQVEVTRVVEVAPEEEALEPLPYNLTPGKPFDGTEITFLICCAGTPQFEAWDRRTDEFTELTGITVNYSYEPWGSMQERIVTESVAGTGSFDVVAWADSWGPAFQQALLPLEPFIENDNLDTSDYPPAFLQGGTFNNHIYGLPVRTHAFVMFYRQDVFDELGLEVPTDWDEVLEVGRAIQDNTELAGIANYYGGVGQNQFVWALMLWGEGGDFFDENWRPIFNNEAGIASMERYMSLREIGQDAQIAAFEGEARDSVMTGESAMITGWWWFYPTFNNAETAAPEVVGNVAFAPLPAVPGTDPTGFAFSMPVGISSFSRNQDASWEFMKWLTSAEIDRAVVLDKSDPATSTIVAAHTSTLGDEEVNEVNGGIHAAALPGLMNSRLMPLIPEWPEVSAILDVAINDMALGADIQTTMDKAAEDAEAVMERAGYYD